MGLRGGINSFSHSAHQSATYLMRGTPDEILPSCREIRERSEVAVRIHTAGYLVPAVGFPFPLRGGRGRERGVGVPGISFSAYLVIKSR